MLIRFIKGIFCHYFHCLLRGSKSATKNLGESTEQANIHKYIYIIHKHITIHKYILWKHRGEFFSMYIFSRSPDIKIFVAFMHIISMILI